MSKMKWFVRLGKLGEDTTVWQVCIGSEKHSDRYFIEGSYDSKWLAKQRRDELNKEQSK